MAQGFVLSERVLTQRGRKKLKIKGIMKFMVTIAEFPVSDEQKLMKDLATRPAGRTRCCSGWRYRRLLLGTAMIVILQLRAYRDVEHTNALFRARAR